MSRGVRRSSPRPSRRAAAALCALPLSLALAACDDDPLTELMVVVETDLAAPADLDAIVLHVTGPSGAEQVVRQPLGGGGAGLPVSLALVPRGSSLGPVEVVAEALKGETTVVTRRARTSFVRDDVRVLVLRLERGCRAVACDATETCSAGACGSPEVAAQSLPRWTGLPPDAGGPDAGGPGTRPGRITVVGWVPARETHAFVLEPAVGAPVDNLTARLEAALGPPARGGGPDDRNPAYSPDGRWLLLSTNRSERCQYGCFVLLPADDLTDAEIVRVGTEPLSGGVAVIDDAAATIVFRGPGEQLALTRRRDDGDGWTEPQVIGDPAWGDVYDLVLSDDSSRVLYTCADATQRRAICETGVDGSGFRVLIDETMAPFGVEGQDTDVSHPDYLPDGSVVFGARWMGNQVWRIPAGGGPPERLSDPFETGYEAPCALPDGRVVAIDYSGEWDFVVLSPTGEELFHLPFPAYPGTDGADWSVGLLGC